MRQGIPMPGNKPGNKACIEEERSHSKPATSSRHKLDTLRTLTLKQLSTTQKPQPGPRNQQKYENCCNTRRVGRRQN